MVYITFLDNCVYNYPLFLPKTHRTTWVILSFCSGMLVVIRFGPETMSG